MTKKDNNICCIDFGTSTTAATIMINGKPQIVNYGHDNCFSTVACVLPDGKIEVCNGALALRSTYPEYFKQEFKLDIAQPLDLNGRNYEDIVAEILRFVKACAEIKNNDKPIDTVVLTIPAIYSESDPRRKVMQKAAIRAGFKDVSFVGEPVAAAHHYAYISGNSNTGGLTLVYDLGGGTFDPVLLENGENGEWRILGYDHGVSCGGQFFDRQIYKYVSQYFKKLGHPLGKSRKIDDYGLCKQLKEELSFSLSASRVFSNAKPFTLTREKLEELIAPLLDLTVDSCNSLLRTAGRKWSEVRRVLLVGGSSAMPLVTKAISAYASMEGAGKIDIVRSASGEKGEYRYLYAVSLGGIAPVSKPKSTPKPTSKPRLKSKSEPVSRVVEWWECSRCGKRNRPIEKDTNYCSNCGAAKQNLTPIYKSKDNG